MITGMCARIDAATDLAKDTSSNDVQLMRIWAQGDYKNFQGKLGKMGSAINDTLIFDNPFSGAALTFGHDVKMSIEAGRISTDELKSNAYTGFGKTASYQGAKLGTKQGDLDLAAGYYHLDWNVKNADNDDANIWFLGASYAFDKNVSFGAQYAKANDDLKGSKKAQDKAYELLLQYKGAQKSNQGSWGAWAAYRYLGETAVLKPTYDAINHGTYGWEIGANYTLFKNIVGIVRYGDNKYLDDDKTKEKILFGRVELSF